MSLGGSDIYNSVKVCANHAYISREENFNIARGMTVIDGARLSQLDKEILCLQRFGRVGSESHFGCSILGFRSNRSGACAGKERMDKRE